MSLATVMRVSAIRDHGDTLSIVSVGDHEVVANKKEDGSYRFSPGELIVYVSENAIVPEVHLKDRGYWDDTKNKGLLGGSKGNRVKARNFAGVSSAGLLWKMEGLDVSEGDDLTDHFGLTEYIA